MDYEKSIYFVEARASSGTEFGTAFLVYTDLDHSYWVTCAHVIWNSRNRGETWVLETPSEDKIEGSPASLRVSAYSVGFLDDRDLAVLQTPPSAAKPLPLAYSRTRGAAQCPGWSKDQVIEPVGEWTLHQPSCEVELPSVRKATHMPRRYYGRSFEVTTRHRTVEPGYSGSPLIQDGLGVIGVVQQRNLDNSGGFSVDIAELEWIWKEMPEQLRLAVRAPAEEAPQTKVIAEAAKSQFHAALADPSGGVQEPLATLVLPEARWKQIEPNLFLLDMKTIRAAVSGVWESAHSTSFLIADSELSLDVYCPQRFEHEMSQEASGGRIRAGSSKIKLHPRDGTTRRAILERLAQDLVISSIPGPLGEVQADVLRNAIVDCIATKLAEGQPFLVTISYIEELSSESPCELVKWLKTDLADPINSRLKLLKSRPRCYFLLISEADLNSADWTDVASDVAGYHPAKSVLVLPPRVEVDDFVRWTAGNPGLLEKEESDSIETYCKSGRSFFAIQSKIKSLVGD